jgi:CheY-like chemotaxis protein
MAAPHILLIDDDRTNNQVATHTLQQMGMRYTTLRSPQELPRSLSMLRDVSAVLLGLDIYNYDGIAYLSELKRYPQFVGIPIVAMSTSGSRSYEAKKAGFNGFVIKPFRAEQFPFLVNKILANTPLWETASLA